METTQKNNPWNASKLLKMEVIGYNVFQMFRTWGADDGTVEECFVSVVEAGAIIMQPRQVRYFCGARCERLERDLLGRVTMYSANYETRTGQGLVEVRAVYR